MYNLDNVTFARQDGEVFRNIYKYGNGQIWWDIDAKNHNVKARYYDGTDGSIATLWDAAALKGDLTIPGAAWTLDQVNDTSSKRLKIGWINSDTAKSIGIADATDYFQVISIPWNSAYPSQILLTASGKQRMYYRTCGNGTWEAPHLLTTKDDFTSGSSIFGYTPGIGSYLNDDSYRPRWSRAGNAVNVYGVFAVGIAPTEDRTILSGFPSPATHSWVSTISMDNQQVFGLYFSMTGELRTSYLPAGNYKINFGYLAK